LIEVNGIQVDKGHCRMGVEREQRVTNRLSFLLGGLREKSEAGGRGERREYM